MSLARTVAILNLLVASRPELGDLPLEIKVRQTGEADLSLDHQKYDVPDIAARLAKALRVDVETYSGTTPPGEPFICYRVNATYRGIPVCFYDYEYPEREQPAAEPVAAPLVDAPGGAV